MCAAVCKDSLTPLHLAALNGTVDELRDILKSEPDVNARDDYGRTALHIAIGGGRLDRIEALINAGASCDLFDVDGSSPVSYAMIHNHYDAMRVMLASKPNLDVQNVSGMTALHQAAALGKLEFVDLLLASGASYDVADSNEQTFMGYLIREICWGRSSKMDLSLLKKILDRTDQMVVTNRATGQTVAHYICKYTHPGHAIFPLIDTIISRQKDINIKNHRGKTPLNLLVKRSLVLNARMSWIFIRHMVQKGAYITKKDCEIILRRDILRDSLFRDIDFCTMTVMNEFDCNLLPKFYSLLHPTTKIPSMEILRMTLLDRVEKVTRNDIQSEIDRNGYCDVSSLVTMSLSKHCIEVYVSHQLQQIKLHIRHLHSEEENKIVCGDGEHKYLRIG